MSFTEIIQEIPKLSLVERQSLMLELQRREHFEASDEFARLFEDVTEIEMMSPPENTELMDALANHLKEINAA